MVSFADTTYDLACLHLFDLFRNRKLLLLDIVVLFSVMVMVMAVRRSSALLFQHTLLT